MQKLKVREKRIALSVYLELIIFTTSRKKIAGKEISPQNPPTVFIQYSPSFTLLSFGIILSGDSPSIPCFTVRLYNDPELETARDGTINVRCSASKCHSAV